MVLVENGRYVLNNNTPPHPQISLWFCNLPYVHILWEILNTMTPRSHLPQHVIKKYIQSEACLNTITSSIQILKEENVQYLPDTTKNQNLRRNTLTNSTTSVKIQWFTSNQNNGIVPLPRIKFIEASDIEFICMHLFKNFESQYKIDDPCNKYQLLHLITNLDLFRNKIPSVFSIPVYIFILSGLKSSM